jgi:glycosyltransferase involved in cell wall biosynthesis
VALGHEISQAHSVDRESLTRVGRGAEPPTAALTYRPLISLITPVHDPDPAALRAAIESVRVQTYDHWQLCLVDDGSTDPRVGSILAEYDEVDRRIKVGRRQSNGGISAASNDALAMATGEFVGFLDHDDELAPDALTLVAELLNDDPQADFVYSDEDKIAPDGALLTPFYKPDWSPEYLRSCPYTCHLSVFRKSLVVSLGGLRSELDGAQDYDLTLRVIERTDRVRHIPKILYHWRMSEASTSADIGAKPDAVEAGRRALADHMRRRGVRGSAEVCATSWFRASYEIVGNPLVSIIIPTRGRGRVLRGSYTNLVTHCVESIFRKTSYGNFEILCVLDEDTPEVVEHTLAGFDDARIRLLRFSEPFNFSRKINLGAVHAEGEHLLLLNDDMEVISDEWLSDMLQFSQQEDIGAVGAKLYFENRTIQHAGVGVDRALPAHFYYGSPPDDPGYFGRLILIGNCSAVTGACLMTRRQVFEEVGGLSPAYALNFNDIDYCMKLRFRGYRVVFTPFAELFHFETSSRQRVVTREEIELFQEQWGGRVFHDPYYNPNFVGGQLFSGEG